jgi:hypothetical protein
VAKRIASVLAHLALGNDDYQATLRSKLCELAIISRSDKVGLAKIDRLAWTPPDA